MKQARVIILIVLLAIVMCLPAGAQEENHISFTVLAEWSIAGGFGEIAISPDANYLAHAQVYDFTGLYLEDLHTGKDKPLVTAETKQPSYALGNMGGFGRQLLRCVRLDPIG